MARSTSEAITSGGNVSVPGASPHSALTPSLLRISALMCSSLCHAVILKQPFGHTLRGTLFTNIEVSNERPNVKLSCPLEVVRTAFRCSRAVSTRIRISERSRVSCSALLCRSRPSLRIASREKLSAVPSASCRGQDTRELSCLGYDAECNRRVKSSRRGTALRLILASRHQCHCTPHLAPSVHKLVNVGSVDIAGIRPPICGKTLPQKCGILRMYPYRCFLL
jgi:hypothetical protein